jgi:hypothetical protein
MDTENGQDDLNSEDGYVSNDDSDNDLEVVEETVDEVKERLQKAEELAKNYKIRAEKAEQAAKKSNVKPTVKETPKNDLSAKDTIAIMRENVADDDIEEVMEYAAFKKLSVAEALKTPQMKSILQVKAEERKIAQASNTGGTKRGTGNNSDQSILAKLDKGELPTSDAEMARAAELRIQQKKQQNKR